MNRVYVLVLFLLALAISALPQGQTGGGGGTGGTVTSVTFTGDGTVLSSTPSSAVTTSGTLTAALANAAANTVLGNFTGSSAAPTYGKVTGSQCPTCQTGPDRTMVGGIVVAVLSSGGANVAENWGSSTGSGKYTSFPFDAWVYNLTEVQTGTAGAGAVIHLGLEDYFGATGFTDPITFSVPQNSVPGAYQSSAPQPVFVPMGVFTGINQSGLNPANSTWGTPTFISASLIGTTNIFLGIGHTASTIAGSTTTFDCQSGNANFTGTESNCYTVIPFNTTAFGIGIATGGAQPSGGALTVTLDVNAVAKSVAAVVPTSGGTSAYFDTAHTQAITAGQYIDWSIANASGSTSATIYSTMLGLTAPADGATGLLVFGIGGTVSSGTRYYTAGLFNTSTTESATQVPMPRAGHLKNLYCYVNSSPGTNPLVFTLRVNAASPASGPTISIGTSTTGVVSDTTDTATVNNKDLIDLMAVQTSGTGASVASCSIGVYP